MHKYNKTRIDSKYQRDTEENKENFLKSIAVTGALFIGGYAIWNLIIGDLFYGILEAILSLCLVVSLVFIMERRLSSATGLGSFVLFYVALQNFCTGGFDNTGMLWSFVFPILIFMIQGGKAGSKWSGSFFLIVAVAIVGDNYVGWYDLPYPDFTLATFVVVFTVISAICYYYQIVLERDQILVAKIARESEKPSKDLLKALSDYKLKTEELEKLNSFMSGRELRMIELKEKIKELEKKKG